MPRWPALLVAFLGACQPLDRPAATARVEPAGTVEPVATAVPVPGVNWAAADDCRDMLVLLKRGLDDGRIVDLEDTPFRLIGDGASTGFSRLPSIDGRVDANFGAASYVPDGRCVLRVGEARDQRSDHRILGREQVRSRYQSGTRREKNPAYEAAKVRLRRAEKAAKPGKSSIVKVGDPLLDLVGTLVGGALTGLGQLGKGDPVEEALENLMATPPSIEHPVYKSYHFERARVRASRAATMPVILTDRRLQRSWQASLKRRELKELYMVTGLDRQDENFARHGEDSLTEDGLRQWLAEAPSLPVADIAAGLLDRSGTIPIDRVALAGPGSGPTPEVPFAGDAALDAAVLPVARRIDLEPRNQDRPPATIDETASRIDIVGETVRAEGVFIAPHFILTPSDVVGGRGVVDVEDEPGHLVLGLVAAVDRGLGLALVQAPLAGRPVAIGWTPAASPGRQQAAAPTSEDAAGTPLLVGGQLVGFRMTKGPDIESEAIRMFLDRQKHLLPAAR